jgi:hypothetical protein
MPGSGKGADRRGDAHHFPVNTHITSSQVAHKWLGGMTESIRSLIDCMTMTFYCKLKRDYFVDTSVITNVSTVVDKVFKISENTLSHPPKKSVFTLVISYEMQHAVFKTGKKILNDLLYIFFSSHYKKLLKILPITIL